MEEQKMKFLIIISIFMLNSFVGAETNKEERVTWDIFYNYNGKPIPLSETNKDQMVNWDETRGERAVRWASEYKQWRKLIKTEDVDVDSYLVSKKVEDMVPYHCQCGRHVFFRGEQTISYDVNSIFVWANVDQHYNAKKIASQQCHNKYTYEQFALYGIWCYGPGEGPIGIPHGY